MFIFKLLELMLEKAKGLKILIYFEICNVRMKHGRTDKSPVCQN